jgi:putative acetyltransferase
MIEVRIEQSDDIDVVRLVNDQAFGQSDEGRIVDSLRNNCEGILSLVAFLNNQIVGHILFSPATLDTNDSLIEGMGLAPMAVLPEFQNRGIGSELVAEGLRHIKRMQCPFVIVLGHDQYYPRFGFQTASQYGLRCQWDGVPDEAFMVLIINASTMKDVSGIVRYRDEFNEAM